MRSSNNPNNSVDAYSATARSRGMVLAQRPHVERRILQGHQRLRRDQRIDRAARPLRDAVHDRSGEAARDPVGAADHRHCARRSGSPDRAVVRSSGARSANCTSISAAIELASRCQ